LQTHPFDSLGSQSVSVVFVDVTICSLGSQSVSVVFVAVVFVNDGVAKVMQSTSKAPSSSNRSLKAARTNR